MTLRSISYVSQPLGDTSVSTDVVLIGFVLIVVAIATYRDPQLATALGTTCAVGALLIVLLIT
ncbi:hypothetical protein E1200_11460 [Actinomadura sp. GC306]|uniref:hypothetical protein n=1 Tax=Actinomadura sp. GC306 TaxID=2530367 RepID=UPI0010531540|nr:hypothetical protein [Actinomadura sp. GC306]TDC68470.1 hypothetical protein E1200_11460 [Actinomadura sp. GC306]